MSFNPLEASFQDLSKKTAGLKARFEKVDADLKWYDSISPSAIQYQLDCNATSIESASKNKKMINDDVINKEREIQDVSNRIGSPFNPKNWFDNTQKQLKLDQVELNAELKNIVRRRGEFVRHISELTHNSESLQQTIAKYDAFNRKTIIDELEQLELSISSFSSELKAVKLKKDLIDSEIAEFVVQYNRCSSEIAAFSSDIEKLKRLEVQLNSCDGYGRKLVHEECTRSFNNSNPSKARHSIEKKQEAKKREQVKVNQRIVQIIARLSRDISKFVIDGNNLCYENSEFVGLNPLLALVPELVKVAPVVIVFDAGIRGLLQSRDDAIRKNFHSIKDVDVHVVASRQLADETVLACAENNAECFVISNDRYKDFLDKDAVKNHRILRHEILEGMVMVHDLNIKKDYRVVHNLEGF